MSEGIVLTRLYDTGNFSDTKWHKVGERIILYVCGLSRSCAFEMRAGSMLTARRSQLVPSYQRTALRFRLTKNYGFLKSIPIDVEVTQNTCLGVFKSFVLGSA